MIRLDMQETISYYKLVLYRYQFYHIVDYNLVLH